MTKSNNDNLKGTKKVKIPEDEKLIENKDSEDDSVFTQSATAKKQDSGRTSDESGSGSEDLEAASSGDDTDQILSKALDMVEKQASESAGIIMSDPKKTSNDKVEVSNKNTTQKIVSDHVDSELESSEEDVITELVNKSKKSKEKSKKKSKVTVGHRTSSSRQPSKQSVTSAAVKLIGKIQANAGALKLETEPGVSPNRLRQRKAVDQAKKRGGLTTRYGNLSTLLELHRILLKGNPFKLIDPKQVYPYFYLISGIDLPHMQPLIRLWQEKATRVLYQLLLIETKCDIARIKRRTQFFASEPNLFEDAFKLKLDIGLENQIATPKPGTSSLIQSQINPTSSKSQKTRMDGENVQPLSKLRKIQEDT